MSKYETLDYDVVLSDDEFEIRKYFNFYIVEYENTNDPEIKEGFRTLFTYISSDNKENEKISMTTPVIKKESKEMKKLAFVVPAKFADQIPEPNNPNLNILKFEEGLFAVIQYSGFSGDSKELHKSIELKSWLLDKGYQSYSKAMTASYNAPFSLPMLRRNEIWIRVSKT